MSGLDVLCEIQDWIAGKRVLSVNGQRGTVWDNLYAYYTKLRIATDKPDGDTHIALYDLNEDTVKHVTQPLDGGIEITLVFGQVLTLKEYKA